MKGPVSVLVCESPRSYSAALDKNAPLDSEAFLDLTSVPVSGLGDRFDILVRNTLLDFEAGSDPLSLVGIGESMVNFF